MHGEKNDLTDLVECDMASLHRCKAEVAVGARSVGD